MKKFKLRDSGKEVKIGDKIVIESVVFGVPTFSDEVIIDEDILELLVHNGLVIEEESEDVEVSAICKIRRHLAARLGWNIQNLNKYLLTFNNIDPMSIFNILLKETAIMMDEKYPDHISSSPKLYIISRIDGHIVELDDIQIKRMKENNCFKHFAFFRKFNDALKAKKMLAPYFKVLYGK